MNFVIPPLLEQESLTLVFVGLGIAIIGMAFGKIKNKDSLQLHRWIMTGAVSLNMIAIGVVMIPSLYLFYSNANNSLTSSFSIIQIIHVVAGFPAGMLALLFVFNDLPQPAKRWMRLTAALWILSVALGAIVYFTMPS